MNKEVYIHPTADVSEKAEIGKGTKIWHQVHVRENVKIGEDCSFGKNVYVDVNVEVGNRAKVQNNVSIYNGVVIEDDVFLGPHMTFTNDPYPRAFSHDWKLLPTRVKNGVSIGANSTIVCGITLNEYSMVGAGSVVTMDVPAYGLVLGVPAKLKRFICQCGHKTQLQKITDQIAYLKCLFCDMPLEISTSIYELSEEYANITREEMKLYRGTK